MKKTCIFLYTGKISGIKDAIKAKEKEKALSAATDRALGKINTIF